MRKGIAVALLMTAAAIAVAEGGERVPPVTDPVVKKECGSCHMVFPPQFLPRRSWQKLADTLADHFGENAGLGEAQRKVVLDYLLANAADAPKAGRPGRKFDESIPAAQTPLRITETPRWVKEHRKVRADRWRAGPAGQVEGELRRLPHGRRAGPLRGLRTSARIEMVARGSDPGAVVSG